MTDESPPDERKIGSNPNLSKAAERVNKNETGFAIV
jgi:hypothetical protein